LVLHVLLWVRYKDNICIRQNSLIHIGCFSLYIISMSTLCLHHSAGNPNRPAVDDWITGNKWYNYIIDGVGKLHRFKDSPNQRECGKTYDLCFSGNFVDGKPTQAQIDTWNTFRDNNPFDEITIHKELAKKGCATASACPGNLLNYISLKPGIINPMPTTDNISDHIVDGMPADERIAALKAQVKKYGDIINSPTDGIAALNRKITEQEELLDSKRKQIEELEKQIESGVPPSLTPEQTADLVLLQEVKTVLAKLL
jgi:hypothetical protein